MISTDNSMSNLIQRRGRSRLEINLTRLLVRCEEMALDTENFTSPENWRLGKYVSALEEMLEELKKQTLNPPSRDQIQEYNGRVDFLKNVLNTAKLPSLPEKVIASQLIQPAQVTLFTTSSGMPSPTEIKHRHNTKYAEDLRRELLGDSPFQQGDNRNEPANNNLNDLVKYHHSIQEKIADHMLDLTRTLKQQVTLAGEVVKKDTELLEKSSNLIDRNEGSLRVETQKLEAYNKRGCKCWVWLMLVIICSIFIGMVLFMRLFKKKRF